MLACTESDSSQLKMFKIISKNKQMDPRFPGDGDVPKPKTIVWLRAVLACTESDSVQC